MENAQLVKLNINIEDRITIREPGTTPLLGDALTEASQRPSVLLLLVVLNEGSALGVPYTLPVSLEACCALFGALHTTK